LGLFWVSGVILQVLGISRENEGPYNPKTTVDIIQGDIPSVQVPGQRRKVLLGVPLSVRQTWPWRIVWFVGGMVSLGSLIPVYQILGRYETYVFYAWIGFQIFWLILRSVYFHYADEMFEINHALYPASEQEMQDPDIQYKILGLIAALADQQIPNHSRNAVNYKLDCTDPQAIMSYFRKADWTLSSNALDCTAMKVNDVVEIEVKAILGDTMMASTSWIQGLGMTNMDLYDSGVVVAEINGQTHLIPVARALSPPEVLENDEEGNIGPVFMPKGSTNDGTTSAWVIWMPAGPNRWIFLSPGLNFVGKLTGKVQDDDYITQVLIQGSLFISLQHVDEIKDTVQKTEIVADALCRVVAPAGKFRNLEDGFIGECRPQMEKVFPESYDNKNDITEMV
jgi:hypothetical protein